MLACISKLNAQPAATTEVFKSILHCDSLLFNVGFNTCNIAQFDSLLSADFEFYHDKDSISYRSVFLYNLKHGLCASPGTYQSRRELLPNTTEVYPMYSRSGVLYGAVQHGIHRFYETVQGGQERAASTARFTHFWLLVNNTWKLSRSFSYDHLVKP